MVSNLLVYQLKYLPIVLSSTDAGNLDCAHNSSIRDKLLWSYYPQVLSHA
jgi:hypothetical protein